MTREQLKAILDRVLDWPPERQQDLVGFALEIEAELHAPAYHATPHELQAIDEQPLSVGRYLNGLTVLDLPFQQQGRQRIL